MHRLCKPGAQGRIVSGLDSMVCDRAGIKVEVALRRQGDMGAGNIEWVLGRRPEALGRGKIVPDDPGIRKKTWVPRIVMQYPCSDSGRQARQRAPCKTQMVTGVFVQGAQECRTRSK